MRKRARLTRMATAAIQRTATGISDRPLSDPRRTYATDRYLASQCSLQMEHLRLLCGAALNLHRGHVSSIPVQLVSYSRRLHNLPAQTISTSTGIAVRNAAHGGVDRKARAETMGLDLLRAAIVQLT